MTLPFGTHDESERRMPRLAVIDAAGARGSA
jgi:hypothetical protein